MTQNPIAWVHFQLRGGWKRAALLLIGGCVLLGALMMLSVAQSFNPNIMKTWAQGLMFLEGAILLLYGPTAVSASIRNDRTSGLIESHRLMPLSPPRAIVGYLLGGGSQALVMGGGAAVLSLFSAMAGGVALDRWIMAQVAIASLTLLVWLAGAIMLVGNRSGGILLAILIFIAFFSGGMLIAFVPAITLLLMPSIAQVAFSMPGQPQSLLPLAIVLQVFLALLFFIAAMRRYARDDLTCFGVFPALGLLVAWAALSVLGLHYTTTLIFNMYSGASDDASARCIVSLSGMLLLGVLPMANAARLAERSNRAGGPTRRQRGLPWLVLGVYLVLSFLTAWQMDRFIKHRPYVVVQSLIVAAAWLAGLWLLLGWVYKAVEGGMILGFIWTVVLWFAPIVADMVQFAAQHPDDRYVSGPIFAISPLGALIQIWSDHPAGRPPQLLLGLSVQIALVLLLLLLYSRRNGRKAAEAVQRGQAAATGA